MLDKDPREVEQRAISVEGIVRESLPYAQYRVEIEGPRQVIAHTPGGPGRNFVRVLIGDRVRLELSPKDLGRGRIVAVVR
jgi:translation initiation factor IF-1